MELIIVYDNDIFTQGKGLKSDWGFSCLVKTKEDTILFDTGEKGEILLNNIKKLNINTKEITKIVLSHEHSDHCGGLDYLLPHLDKIDLFRLNTDEKKYNNINLIKPEKPKEISKNIWTTGKIKGVINEQSLVLKGKYGWFVLTGCSHPSVEKILDCAKKITNDKITGIIGGFHGFDKFTVVKDLDYIYPCHCTSHKKELKNVFPKKVNDCGVGKIINLDVKI